MTEDQVVSPALDSIPRVGTAASEASEQTLVLKDGRRIQVLRLARRGGQVLFQTTRGEGFSVPEDQVVSPPVESIQSLDAGAPAPTTPEVVPSPEAPAPPPVPAAPTAPVAEPDYEPVDSPLGPALPADPRWPRAWRIIDPYNQNILKGDKPIIGNSVFFVFTGVLDVPSESRRLPVPGRSEHARSGHLRVLRARPAGLHHPARAALGRALRGPDRLQAEDVGDQGDVRVSTSTTSASASATSSTWTCARARAAGGRTSHWKRPSPRSSWPTSRATTTSSPCAPGIQPFVSDFRGLIFSDFNLGGRLFGSLANNRLQYNAAYFDLLEKETNSELNTFEKREQKVLIGNVFFQDFLAKGYTISASYHDSKDEANFHYDANGFLARPAPVGRPVPHEVRSRYVGLAGDGHVGRLNLSHAFYYAFGDDELNVVAGQETKIRAQLAALEASIDKDWVRLKGSFFFASGDSEPLDDRATGFDSIYDNSNFAGGPFSFWSRSGIFLTQTKVLLKGPLSLLPSLRSNKFEGQANFVNPGLVLAGAGLDVEVTPKIKAVLNANYLRFHKMETLEALLFQPELRKTIGVDLGAGLLYRPMLNENILFLGGITGLLPGAGWDDIYTSQCPGVPECGASGKKLWNAFLQVKLTY